MPDPINLTASAPYFLAAFLFGYLLGSIPFGLLLTRMAGLGDVRAIGSGNIGATNVLRTGRKDVAAATLLLDAAKGFAAVFITGAFFGPALAALAAIGALVGHCYPIWLRFKGGKGVATFLGILIALSWPHAALFAAVWLAMAATLRYSSLSALVACLCVPVSAYLFSPASLLGSQALGEVTIILVVLIFWKHRENIKRLLSGQESRIGGSKTDTSAPPDDMPNDG